MACPFIEDPVDEEAYIVQWDFQPPPAPRVFQDRTNTLMQTDSYLWERYRFSRQSIVYLCSLLEPHIIKVTGCSQSLTTVQSDCIALRFFASGTFLYSVGDAERLSKATVCREDSRLTLSELLDKMDFIKISTITDYGGMRVDKHDEL